VISGGFSHLSPGAPGRGHKESSTAPILSYDSDSIGVRIRRLIDRCVTRFPDFAFGLLLVLRKQEAFEK
jgi:hypothetical protein